MVMTINAERLWRNLMQMAEIGATDKGGCNRQCLTDLDMKGRALFAGWCAEIGLEISYDAAGNMFAQMQSEDDTLPPLVLGSHLDTQPTGGKYDGVLGVLAALEVLTRLYEEKITPPRPIAIANWMNEEGARFAPAMMGSGIWAGMLDLQEMRAIKDTGGTSVGEELDRHSLSGHRNPQEQAIHAYLELHIEQGPILEQSGDAIGVVTGAQAIRWYELCLTGIETHAGPTPMALRHDPVEWLPELIAGVMKIGKCDEKARATIGQIHTYPHSRNVVPGKIEVSVDLRHPDEEQLSKMDAMLRALAQSFAAKGERRQITLEQIWHSPVVSFDPALIAAVRQGARQHGLPNQDIISGAGHDALMVARKAPTAMIFIPCKDGVSHNEAEHIEPEQAEAGANVLLSALLSYLDLA